MAGAGYRVFSAGAVLTAAQVNTFLMEQSVMNFAGTAARGSALASVLSAGQMAHVGGGTVTVYDGSAWQQVYPAQAGLVYVAGTAFSAVSSVSVNSCFTSTYANYRILVNGTSSGADISLRMRLRASGTDNTSSNYFNQGMYVAVPEAITLVASNTAAYFPVGFFSSATGNNIASLDLFSPQASEYTAHTALGFQRKTSNASFTFYAGNMTVTTQYDGFTLYPDAGTFTGTVRVYGYRNS